jgi:WD40 repeat protein
MLRLEGHKGRVLCVAFASDGRTLASGSGDRAVKLWEPATGKERATLKGHRYAVLGLSFSPDGRLLASASADRTVRLWDLASRQETACFRGAGVKCSWKGVTFSPDGKLLAAGSEGWFWNSGEGSGVTVWDVASGKEIASLDVARQKIWSVSFSPDGRTLAIGTQGSGVVFWDYRSGARRCLTAGRTVRAVAYAPGGRTLAAAAAQAVELWEVPAGTMRLLKGHRGLVWSVAFAPDGDTLLSGSKDGNVCLWDATTGRARAAFNWDVGKLNAVAVSPDGMLAAAGGARRAFVLWDLA